MKLRIRLGVLVANASNLVNGSNILAATLFSKIDEQIGIAERLVELVPADRLGWQPAPGTFRLDELLGHLLEAAAGFCAALYAMKPDEMAGLKGLRDLRVNHRCGVDEARDRLREYTAHIAEAFRQFDDSDLVRRLETVFVPEGEPAMAVLLGNLEHFMNHKHQLFFYLKLLGVEIGSRELYRFRPAPNA